MCSIAAIFFLVKRNSNLLFNWSQHGRFALAWDMFNWLSMGFSTGCLLESTWHILRCSKFTFTSAAKSCDFKRIFFLFLLYRKLHCSCRSFIAGIVSHNYVCCVLNISDGLSCFTCRLSGRTASTTCLDSCSSCSSSWSSFAPRSPSSLCTSCSVAR